MSTHTPSPLGDGQCTLVPWGLGGVHRVEPRELGSNNHFPQLFWPQHQNLGEPLNSRGRTHFPRTLLWGLSLQDLFPQRMLGSFSLGELLCARASPGLSHLRGSLGVPGPLGKVTGSTASASGSGLHPPGGALPGWWPCRDGGPAGAVALQGLQSSGSTRRTKPQADMPALLADIPASAHSLRFLRLAAAPQGWARRKHGVGRCSSVTGAQHVSVGSQ